MLFRSGWAARAAQPERVRIEVRPNGPRRADRLSPPSRSPTAAAAMTSSRASSSGSLTACESPSPSSSTSTAGSTPKSAGSAFRSTHFRRSEKFDYRGILHAVRFGDLPGLVEVQYPGPDDFRALPVEAADLEIGWRVDFPTPPPPTPGKSAAGGAGKGAAPDLFQVPRHRSDDPACYYPAEAAQRRRRRGAAPSLGMLLFAAGFAFMPAWWVGALYVPRRKDRAVGAAYDWRKRNRQATVVGASPTFPPRPSASPPPRPPGRVNGANKGYA